MNERSAYWYIPRSSPRTHRTSDVVVFLDVDGTISAFDDLRSSPPPNGFSDTADVPELGEVCISPTMLARLWELPAKLVWATTWEHDANRICDRFNLTHLEVAVHAASVGVWWKYATVTQVIAAHAPSAVVWCDDELSAHRVDLEAAFACQGVDVLLISPRETTGLTVADVDAIETFCTQQQ